MAKRKRITKTRRFNGKTYYTYGTINKKSEARIVAQGLRKKNYNARVVKTGPRFMVFRRKK